MSFFDKAKQAATEMAAKADQAMANAGLTGATGGVATGSTREIDAALRDYGLLMWRQAHGQPVDPAERGRIEGVLEGLESAGSLAHLQMNSGPTSSSLFGGPTPTPPPPPPGAAAAQQSADTSPPPPPPPSTPPPPTPPPSTPPPPPPGGPAGGSESTQSGGGTAPPPPPPSWS